LEWFDLQVFLKVFVSACGLSMSGGNFTWMIGDWLAFEKVRLNEKSRRRRPKSEVLHDLLKQW
jgi:hypothetical protein